MKFFSSFFAIFGSFNFKNMAKYTTPVSSNTLILAARRYIVLTAGLRADYVETCNCDFGWTCNFSGFPSNCSALSYNRRELW